jgi:hypothetical protein
VDVADQKLNRIAHEQAQQQQTQQQQQPQQLSGEVAPSNGIAFRASHRATWPG